MFILLAIIGISVIVFFHELGHFIVSKICGVKVEEFGLGYPPRVFGFVLLRPDKVARNKTFFRISCRKFSKFIRNSFRFVFRRRTLREAQMFKFFLGKGVPPEAKTRTIYSLNWIPFGGFNKLKGELEETREKDAFFVQVWWKKALVGFGGPALNIILAILIFSTCFFIGIPTSLDQDLPQGAFLKEEIGIQIAQVFPASPAEKAGVNIGDIIVSVDENNFKEVDEIQTYIKEKIGQTVRLRVKRKQEIKELEVKVVPAETVFKDIKDSYGVIGIFLAKTGIVSYPGHQAIFQGIKTVFLLIGRLFYGFWLILKTLIVKREMIGQLVGPVGITVMIGQMARVGFIYFLQITAFLSTALGAFQLIPFPALDGSRILSSFIEGARGRPVSPKKENIVLTIGFYLLILLLIWITYRELIGLAEKFFK